MTVLDSTSSMEHRKTTIPGRSSLARSVPRSSTSSGCATTSTTSILANLRTGYCFWSKLDLYVVLLVELGLLDCSIAPFAIIHAKLFRFFTSGKSLSLVKLVFSSPKLGFQGLWSLMILV